MKKTYRGDLLEPHSKEDGQKLNDLIEDKCFMLAEVAKAAGFHPGAIPSLINGDVATRSKAKWQKAMTFLQMSPSVPPLSEIRAEVTSKLSEYKGRQGKLAEDLGIEKSAFYGLLRGDVLGKPLRRRIHSALCEMSQPKATARTTEKAVKKAAKKNVKKAHSNGVVAQNGAPKRVAVKMRSKGGELDLACIRPAVQAKVAKVQLLADLGTNKYNKDEERYILEALSKV